MKTFCKLINDLSPKIFFERYWTKKEYLSKNNLFNEKWFGLKDIEQIITMTKGDLSTPEIRLIKQGKRLSPHHYQINENKPGGEAVTYISFDKIVNLYENGTTLSLRGLDKIHPGLDVFSSELAREFREETQINAYLTPKNAQGFDAHYDHHEIFILQLMGEKVWTLYDLYPYPLPVTGHYDQGKPDQNSARQYVLKPGDVLYIPRGMWHEAKTTETSSLHLTLNVKCRLEIDFLHWMVDEMAKVNVDVRKNLIKSPLEPLIDNQQDFMKRLNSFKFEQQAWTNFNDRHSKKTTFNLPF